MSEVEPQSGKPHEIQHYINRILEGVLDEGEAVNAYLDEIESFIDDNSCISYRALCGYARECRPEWTEVIRHNTIHLMAYIKSFEWEIKMESLKNS